MFFRGEENEWVRHLFYIGIDMKFSSVGALTIGDMGLVHKRLRKY